VQSAVAFRATRQATHDSPLFSLSALSALASFVDQARASARAFFKLQRIARTIADLDQAEEVLLRHAREAITFRVLDTPEESPLQKLRRIK